MSEYASQRVRPLTRSLANSQSKMSWLSLKVLNSPQGCVFISVPKKIVPLAVGRNRLKRLIREAVRVDSYFRKDKCFTFRVTRYIKGLKLEDVRREIEAIKK